QQRQRDGADGHLVEQHLLGRHLHQPAGTDGHRGQPPQRARRQAQQIAAPGHAGAALHKAFAQRKRHGDKGANQADPLHAPQPLGRHQQ
ncbi:hypothetical protein DKP78_19980, partial [Enterococcus faecium]